MELEFCAQIRMHTLYSNNTIRCHALPQKGGTCGLVPVCVCLSVCLCLFSACH